MEYGTGKYLYKLIDKKKLFELLEIGRLESYRKIHNERIEHAISSRNLARKSQWTESIAVGSERFTEDVKSKLGVKVNYRTIEKVDELHTLREKGSFYKNIDFP